MFIMRYIGLAIVLLASAPMCGCCRAITNEEVSRGVATLGQLNILANPLEGAIEDTDFSAPSSDIRMPWIELRKGIGEAVVYWYDRKYKIVYHAFYPFPDSYEYSEDEFEILLAAERVPPARGAAFALLRVDNEGNPRVVDSTNESLLLLSKQARSPTIQAIIRDFDQARNFARW